MKSSDGVDGAKKGVRDQGTGGESWNLVIQITEDSENGETL